MCDAHIACFLRGQRMNLKEQIMDYIERYPGVSDNDLEKKFNKLHQTINQSCRTLAKEGLVIRKNNPEKHLIGNYPTGIKMPKKNEVITNEHSEELSEEEIKQVLKDYLEEEGWSCTIAWGHMQGVDIEAKRKEERWRIEVKGPGSRQPMRVNYFIGILGEILQRMDAPNVRYSIALPDMKQYRGLWHRLPKLAKERTKIDLLLVDATGKISEVR